MKIQQIPINKISPDVNQPRTIFDEKGIQELAESIKIEHIINPIELDPNFVIILGERRFRAAKLAGLKTIPATIKEIYPRERFIRQLNENLHTGGGSSMAVMDIANAFAKILDDLEGDRKENIKELSRKIGKEIQYINVLLELREEKGDVKTYLETPNAKYTLIRAINHFATSTHLQNKLKEKVIKEEISNGRTLSELINAIKRNPEREKQLLKIKYTGKEVENIIKINQISPQTNTTLDAVSRGIDVANKFQGLLLSMKGLDLNKISKYDRMQIKKLIEVLIPQANQIHAQIFEIQQKDLTKIG